MHLQPQSVSNVSSGDSDQFLFVEMVVELFVLLLLLLAVVHVFLLRRLCNSSFNMAAEMEAFNASFQRFQISKDSLRPHLPARGSESGVVYKSPPPSTDPATFPPWNNIPVSNPTTAVFPEELAMTPCGTSYRLPQCTYLTQTSAKCKT